MLLNTLSFLLGIVLTWVSNVYCVTVPINETGDSIYHKNLRAKTDETVLCIDEYAYLHPHTERYLVAKLHQILHTCLNTYGKKIHIFPWDNETLRDTEHRLHSTHLKRSMFQIVENWYLNLIFFTYGRLYNFRRLAHNVTDDYLDCSKKDIKKFWHHDQFFSMFFNQVKRHLRQIIRHHYINLEKAFYMNDNRQMMHTYLMNATIAPYTIKFTQVFRALHLVDFFRDIPPTKTLSTYMPMFRFAEDDEVTKTKRRRKPGTTAVAKSTTTVRRPRIFNLSALGFTYPRMPFRRTAIRMTSELIRAADYENRTDLPFVRMREELDESMNRLTSRVPLF